MFEFDSGDQGSSGPYLKWHVQGNKQISENSFSIKESGEGQPRVDVTDKMKKSVVIDIDNRGDESADNKAQKILGLYPTNLVSRTGSGGYHLFYRYPHYDQE